LSTMPLQSRDRWTKLSKVFYLLIGIGILVEILRRLGVAFVAVSDARSKEGRRRQQEGEQQPRV
jgi:hypothetical protein